MRKTEIILTTSFLLSFIFVLNSGYVSYIVSFLLGLGLILYCIYQGFASLKHASVAAEKGLGLVSYTIGTFLVIFSSLYALMFLPLAQYMVYITAIVMGIITLGTFAMYISNKSIFSKDLIIRNSSYILWILLLALIPNASLLEYKYSCSPYYSEYIDAKKKASADPQNKQLMQAEMEALTKMRRSRK